MARAAQRQRRADVLAGEKQYAWRPGSRFAVDAQVAGEELERIANEQDAPVPSLPRQVVVDQSEPEEAPLHDAFTWDNDKAANLYRLSEAGQLIRSIRIVTNEEDGIDPAPAYVSVRLVDSTEAVYVETTTVWSEAALRQQVLSDAYKQLQGLRARYRHLSELEAVFREIDRLAAPV